MPSLLSYLARAAPGVLARGQQGRMQGEQLRRQQDLAEQQRQDAENRVIEQHIMDAARFAEQQRQFNVSQQATADERTEARKYRESMDTYNRARQAEQDARAAAAAALAQSNADRIYGIQKDRLEIEKRRLERMGQPKPGKPVSEAGANALAVTQGLLKSATDLRAKFGQFVAEGQNVSGPIRGRMSPILQAFRRQPSEVTNAQAGLANLSSDIMKARSGGAITPQEFERLEPFLADRNTDEVSAQDKLASLVQELGRVQEEKLEALEDIGRDVSKLKGRYSPEIARMLEQSRVPSISSKSARPPLSQMPK